MKLCLVLLILLISLNSRAEEEIPGLVIEELADGVFLHQSFNRVEGFGLVSSNGLVVVNEGKAFIIDTPWSVADTEKLAAWIDDQGYELSGSLSTHSHDDRTAGIERLNEHAIPSWASSMTNEILETLNKPTAGHTFEGSEFSMAGETVEVFYPGGGHTADNIVVWLPKSGVLFGGCLVRSLGATGLGYTGEARIAEWPGSINKVLQKYPDAVIVVPGHGKSGDIELLYHTRQLADSAASSNILQKR